MDPMIKNLGFGVLGRFIDYVTIRLTSSSKSPTEKRLEGIEKTIQSLPADEPAAIVTTGAAAIVTTGAEGQIKLVPTSNPIVNTQDIATACVCCALGHFSTSSGLLNEAARFKKEGLQSNEILDRIAKVLEEQNALERVDLTEEKLQRTPQWEREIAEEALEQSRKLRHKLEGITSINELEQAAADTASYYRRMNRDWYKGRFAHLGNEKAEAIASRISPEDKE